jgi:PBP1b-binding outer membrane lipoprotein LpoB
MKKMTMISAIISASLLLTACSKEGAFKSAINDSLKAKKCHQSSAFVDFNNLSDSIQN